MADRQHPLNVEFPKDFSGGVYANSMGVTHTREEFIVDFAMMAPPTGRIMARIIVSPGHMKRMIRALQENLGIYEQQFGQVFIDEPSPSKIPVQ